MLNFKKQVEETNNESMKKVGQYLLERASADKTIEKAIVDKEVDLKDVYDYITEQAREKAVNGCAMVENEEVYGWAVHYVIDEPKKEKTAEKTEEKKTYVPTKTTTKPVKTVKKEAKKIEEPKDEQLDLFGNYDLSDL